MLALAASAVLVTGLILKATAAAAGDVVRLAVLPFENRGAPDDGYFVDGVADQVRGKLMSVAGFQIIARASSDRYRAAKKTPQEIGRELGVDYLLTSTVTWVKSADGKGRVQVVPELIDVRTGAASWQQSFDAELTDIFQVQGTIASQVAGALNVALAPAEADAACRASDSESRGVRQFPQGQGDLRQQPSRAAAGDRSVSSRPWRSTRASRRPGASWRIKTRGSTTMARRCLRSPPRPAGRSTGSPRWRPGARWRWQRAPGTSTWWPTT